MNATKILVVDDDEKILFAFHKVLEREGCTSIVAKNGAEALVKLVAEQPQLIFLDILLPDFDGLEVLRQIKQQSQSTPVILITAHGTLQTKAEAAQLGAFDYLTKPLSVATVREVMYRALHCA
jgi:DNA-binding NtrC family response regulator